jgi:hypothetical protein
VSQQIKLRAPDISCNHCAMAIQKGLGKVQGIASVSVDVPSKMVTFDYADEAALVRAKAALDDLGYPAKAA